MPQKTKARVTKSKISKFNELSLYKKIALAAIAVLVIGGLGTVAFTKYKQQQLISKAGSYTKSTQMSYDVWFCRRAYYGDTTTVRSIFRNRTGKPAPTAFMRSFKSTTVPYQKIDQRAWYWTASVIDITAPSNGWVSAGIYGYGETQLKYVATMGYC